jgi:hypothetical protein
MEQSHAATTRAEEFPVDLAPDLPHLIDQELKRLPESYRQPVVLCYVEGLTHHEAARRLGWPLGTVKIRLSRGRRLLRERLDRRGVGLGALLLVLWKPAQGATVSAPLVNSTVRALTRGGVGNSAACALTSNRPPKFAQTVHEAGAGSRLPWLWPLVVMVAILLGATGTTVYALQGSPRPEVDPASLPSNLTNVLTVDCG